jgi:hypothetical protein
MAAARWAWELLTCAAMMLTGARLLLSLAALGLVAVAAQGCGSTAQDACVKPLSSFGCPATLEAARSQPCPKYTNEVATGTCGSYGAYSYTFGASQTTCLYDSSNKLVGARFEDDIPDLCNNTTNVSASASFAVGCSYEATEPIACGGTDAGTSD